MEPMKKILWTECPVLAKHIVEASGQLGLVILTQRITWPLPAIKLGLGFLFLR